MIGDKDGMVSRYDIIHTLQGWIHGDMVTEKQEIALWAVIGFLASDDYDEEQLKIVEEEQTEPIQEEPKEEEPVKKAPRKRSKPLDKGKVGALYKAGWNVAKIADEMRCNQSSIYRVIREMGL